MFTVCEVYARYEADIAAARTALARGPGQLGAVVYLEGRWVGLELLAGPALAADHRVAHLMAFPSGAIDEPADRRR